MSKHQVCVVFSVPEDLEHRSIEAQDHPGWDADDYIVSRRVGDAWLASNASTVLLVPSVVFNVDRNVLINPSHRDFRRVDVVSTEPVRWDTRLFHRRDAIDGER
jgi:RES domain-containing protein